MKAEGDGEVGDWRALLADKGQITQGLDAQSMDGGQRKVEMFYRSGGGEPGMLRNN